MESSLPTEMVRTAHQSMQRIERAHHGGADAATHVVLQHATAALREASDLLGLVDQAVHAGNQASDTCAPPPTTAAAAIAMLVDKLQTRPGAPRAMDTVRDVCHLLAGLDSEEQRRALSRLPPGADASASAFVDVLELCRDVAARHVGEVDLPASTSAESGPSLLDALLVLDAVHRWDDVAPGITCSTAMAHERFLRTHQQLVGEAEGDAAASSVKDTPREVLDQLRGVDGREWVHQQLAMDTIFQGFHEDDPAILEECERIAGVYLPYRVRLCSKSRPLQLLAMWGIHLAAGTDPVELCRAEYRAVSDLLDSPTAIRCLMPRYLNTVRTVFHGPHRQKATIHMHAFLGIFRHVKVPRDSPGFARDMRRILRDAGDLFLPTIYPPDTWALTCLYMAYKYCGLTVDMRDLRPVLAADDIAFQICDFDPLDAVLTRIVTLADEDTRSAVQEMHDKYVV